MDTSTLLARIEQHLTGGLATDWAEYADWMLAVLDEEPRLANPHPGFSPRWDGRPSTKRRRSPLRRTCRRPLR